MSGAAVVVLTGVWLLGLFGSEYRDGYSVLVILMLATVPEALANSTTQIIQSRERMWLVLGGVVLPSYALLVASAHLLTPSLGARGLAWSYVVAMSLAFINSASIARWLGFREANATKPTASVPQ